MIPSLRKQFNSSFTPQKYQTFLRRIDDLSGTHVEFRLCETPCFFPKPLLDGMARAGEDLIRQLVTPEYHRKSDAAIPAEFNVPNEPPHPMFIQVDFGLVRDASGELKPKLVELQGFPSLYAYQVALAESYLEVYGLGDGSSPTISGTKSPPSRPLKCFLSGLDSNSYRELLARAIVERHDPANVILMEIDPQTQKTLPDFLLTKQMLGIPTINIVDIKKEGSRLYYESAGKRIPIRRIYNRTIVDDLQRKGVELAFDWRDELDVEWAGHPNWYFRMSKFSIPYLDHEAVPKTCFLDQLKKIPPDLENYALKPLYSFAGRGVVIAPRKEEITAISAGERHDYILQERMHFEPVIDTPFGPTRAEVRIMYVWVETLTPVLTIIRMGRGLMMGVDHNRNMEWVGASASLFSED